MRSIFLYSILGIVYSCCGNNKNTTQTNPVVTMVSDTVEICEQDGFLNMTIRKGDSTMEIKQTGDFFDNKRTYTRIFEYNDNYNKVSYYINDTINMLSYNQSESFRNDSIYDINKDGIRDLVLTYNSSSSTKYVIYLFDLSGLVAEEKNIYNYFPLSNREFIQTEPYGLDVIFFQKLKWSRLQIDTLEQLYYYIGEKKSYSTPPLEIIDGIYVKNKNTKSISQS